MNGIAQRARELESEIRTHRRTIHSFAEIGFDLPQTTAYVLRTLKEYGYEPKMVGKAGITCTAGKPGKTFLLRADMDALPMEEKTGLEFAATNGHCHSCGHDMHTAMLLGAAKILKENEDQLAGTVKLMFQPAEEILGGSQDMIENGIMLNPRVDAAMAIHVMAGKNYSRCGDIICRDGCVANSGDAVRIEVFGRDAHGSRPELGVDAIHIAAHILFALDELTTREIPMDEESIVLVGQISGGTTCNSIPGSAVMELSVRTTGPKQREFLCRRIEELSMAVASMYHGTAKVTHVYGTPALVNNSDLLKDVVGYLKECYSEEYIQYGPAAGDKIGSEDFTRVAELVPSIFLQLGVGSLAEGHEWSLHHPAVKMNEQALTIGTTALVQSASRWLEEHS